MVILIFGCVRFCELKLLKLGHYVFIIIITVYEDSTLHILQVRLTTKENKVFEAILQHEPQ